MSRSGSRCLRVSGYEPGSWCDQNISTFPWWAVSSDRPVVSAPVLAGGQRSTPQSRPLANGRPVAVMLEGRIVPPEKRDESGLGKVRRGFLEIVRAADAVVLPIAIVGSDEVWPSTSRFPRLGWRGRPLVQIHVGEVMTIDDLTNSEALETVRAVMASQIARLS